jgi:hypothetical protein
MTAILRLHLHPAHFLSTNLPGRGRPPTGQKHTRQAQVRPSISSSGPRAGQADCIARKSAQNNAEVRELLTTNLFALLVYGMGRKDADHDFIFDRCLEVQRAPDG